MARGKGKGNLALLFGPRRGPGPPALLKEEKALVSRDLLDVKEIASELNEMIVRAELTTKALDYLIRRLSGLDIRLENSLIDKAIAHLVITANIVILDTPEGLAQRQASSLMALESLQHFIKGQS